MTSRTTPKKTLTVGLIGSATILGVANQQLAQSPSAYLTPAPIPSSSAQIPTATLAPTGVNTAANASSNSQAVPAATATAGASSRIVYTFRDPRNGIIYDRYEEPENVPGLQWKTEVVKEKRWVPKLVNKTVKVTQVEYQPVYSYRQEQQIINRWNPLATPQATTKLVPVVDYQPVNRTVDQVVQVQEYVEEEVSREIPRLVQVTESRVHYVDRPRPGQNVSASVAAPTVPASQVASSPTNYATSPINGVNSYAATGYSQAAPLGYSPTQSIAVPSPVFQLVPQSSVVANQPRVLTAPIAQAAPGLNTNYAQAQVLPPQTVATPATVALGSTPRFNLASLNPFNAIPKNASTVPATTVAAQTSTTASRPLIQWPGWMTSNGPIFKTSIFKEDRSLPGVTPPAALASSGNGALSFGNTNSLPVGDTARQFSNSSNASGLQPQMTMQPTPNPYSVATPRTAEQGGMPATVLR